MLTQRLVLSYALVAVGLSIVGCDESHGGGAPRNIPIAQVPNEYAAVACDKIDACLGLVATIFLPTSDCDTYLSNQFSQGEYANYNAAVDAGRIIYDGLKAGQCINAIRGGGCETIQDNGGPEVCDQVFTGTVEVGGACTLDEECPATAYCAFSGVCPGACANRKAAGASCNGNDECTRGLVCDGSGKCSAPVAAGGACDGEPGLKCASGLACVGGDSETTGTCQATGGLFIANLGQACNFQAGPFCRPELSCAVAPGSPRLNPTFRCAALAAAGAACTAGVPTSCVEGYYCNTPSGSFDGTCTQLPGAGASCASDVFGRSCADGLVCASGTCTALALNGAACTTDEGCYSSNCDDNVCVAPQCEATGGPTE